MVLNLVMDMNYLKMVHFILDNILIILKQVKVDFNGHFLIKYMMVNLLII